MPTARRTRLLAAPPDVVWRSVGDPHQQPRWWPRVLRVEDVRGGHFTQVLQTDRGRNVRADHVVVASRRPELWRIEQEVDGTPFESIVAAAQTEFVLQPAGEDGTLVTMTISRRMKGVARFGGMLMRRATNRQIDAALDGLEALHGARP